MDSAVLFTSDDDRRHPLKPDNLVGRLWDRIRIRDWPDITDCKRAFDATTRNRSGFDFEHFSVDFRVRNPIKAVLIDTGVQI